MAAKIQHNIKILALMILIALSAAGIDWIVDKLVVEHPAEPGYSGDRIVYATFYGLIGLAVLRNENNMTKKSVWISLFITVALHARYYLQGYDTTFIVLFLSVHFLVIFLPMALVFNNFPELFGNPVKKSSLTPATLSRFKRFGRTGQ